MTGHKYSRLDASPPPPPFPPSNKQKQAARQAVVDSTDLGVLSMLQVVPAYVAHESLDSVNLLIMWDSQSETLAQGTLSHVACQELARQRSRTTASNIVQHLKPALEVLLMVMLKPAHMSLADMHAFADAIVQFHNYFTRFDWESTWASSVVGHSIPSTGHSPCTYAEWHLSSCVAAAAAAAAAAADDEQSCAAAAAAAAVDEQSCAAAAAANHRLTFT